MCLAGAASDWAQVKPIAGIEVTGIQVNIQWHGSSIFYWRSFLDFVFLPRYLVFHQFALQAQPIFKVRQHSISTLWILKRVCIIRRHTSLKRCSIFTRPFGLAMMQTTGLSLSHG